MLRQPRLHRRRPRLRIHAHIHARLLADHLRDLGRRGPEARFGLAVQQRRQLGAPVERREHPGEVGADGLFDADLRVVVRLAIAAVGEGGEQVAGLEVLVLGCGV